MSDNDTTALMRQNTQTLLEKGRVVKVDNSFNQTHEFNRLNAIEQNISWAIISMFSTGDTDDEHSKVTQCLTVDSVTIRNLAGIGPSGSRITKVDYRKTLEKLRHFFLTQYFVVHIKEGGMLFERGTPVFRHFDILNDGEKVSLELMPESTHFFAKIFDGLGFSVFALQKMIDIPTPTAKTLYRLFLDGKHFNGWNATYAEICEEFGFTKRPAFYTFYRRLPEYIKQIKDTGDFDVLDYQPIRDETKRGHPIVSIFFNIKVNPNRLKKLLKHYHPQKKRAPPKFYPLKVSRAYSNDVLKTKGDGILSVKQDTWHEMIDVKCPKCGGTVSAFIKKDDGKVAFICSNSHFWSLGNQNCGFYAEAEQPSRLSDDIKSWIKSTLANSDNDDLAACLRKLDLKIEASNENKVTGQVIDTTDNDEPFPMG